MVKMAGAPRAERRPGASSNMTDFRCCELLFFQTSQFFRSKSERFFRSKLGDLKKKRSSPKFQIQTHADFVGPLLHSTEANGLPEAHGPRGHCTPLSVALENGYLPPVTVTSDVIGQFYVRLFFGLELVLIMIRVGAKFRLYD